MQLHPVDYFNYYGIFKDIFTGVKSAHLITDNECACPTAEDPNPNKATFKCTGTNIEVLRDNSFGLTKGATISKFTLLSAVKFKHSHSAAISYIQYDLMGEKIPYIRVGVDYFKIIHKDTRYGGTHSIIKHWLKDTITTDHSKSFIQQIPKFDDFTIVPDNKNYQPIIKNCYNLYSEFSHTPFDGEVKETDIPTTISFIKHIFGDQFDMGITYFKVIYEMPQQILPVLCLVSAKNETGKTTFINFMEMILGGNYVLISPDALTKDFNSNYATKNVIALEETFVEKQMGVEKIKSLSTGKSISVNRKFIEDHSIPFFGKLILNTNKVKDFMKINSEEIRFWIREVPVITGVKNNKIESQLFEEIPKFLKYLIDQLPVQFSQGSRMVFSKDQLETMALHGVKEESKSGLYKEIEILIEEYFNQNLSIKSFKAGPGDIKDKWFRNDTKISMAYIRKVLIDEMKLIQLSKCRYKPFEDPNSISKVSCPFQFTFTGEEFIEDGQQLKMDESGHGII